MPNSSRSSKMQCHSDANPVSCNWGLRENFIFMVFLAVKDAGTDVI